MAFKKRLGELTDSYVIRMTHLVIEKGVFTATVLLMSFVTYSSSNGTPSVDEGKIFV